MPRQNRVMFGIAAALLLTIAGFYAVPYARSEPAYQQAVDPAALQAEIDKLKIEVEALKTENEQVAIETAKVAAETARVAAETTKVSASVTKVATDVSAALDKVGEKVAEQTTTLDKTLTSQNKTLTSQNDILTKMNVRQEMRFIDVIGIGEAVGQPDLAVLQVGAEAQAPSSGEALARVTKQGQALLKVLKASGAEIEPANPSVTPITDEKRQTIGYSASLILLVKIKDPAGSGKVLVDAVSKLAGNNMKGIEFKMSDPNKLKTEARKLAIEDARKLAKVYADSFKVTLGDIQMVSENLLKKEIDVSFDPTKPQVPKEKIQVLVSFAIKP